MSKIIVIEGSDFTGKTTTAQLLASSIGAKFFCCPKGETELSQTLYERLKSDVMDERTKDAITLALHVENSERILYRALQGHSIVVDRNYLSLLAYAQDYFREFITSNEQHYKIFEPDLTVILHADMDILIKRYTERDDVDTLDDYYMANMRRINEFYSSVPSREAANQLVINTSHTQPNDVVNRIMMELDHGTI